VNPELADVKSKMEKLVQPSPGSTTTENPTGTGAAETPGKSRE
jgi:hypothetical protein